jgi:hypothetical protein
LTVAVFHSRGLCVIFRNFRIGDITSCSITRKLRNTCCV